MCDQKGYKISQDSFGTIVSQYINCSSFEIIIRVSSDVNDAQFYKVAAEYLFLRHYLSYHEYFFLGIESILDGRKNQVHLRRIRKNWRSQQKECAYIVRQIEEVHKREIRQ